MSVTRLHPETVSLALMEVLRAIQGNPVFKDFRLVGGTALALQYGHRKSIDLDFFGFSNLPNNDIAVELGKLGKVVGLKNTPSIKVYVLNDIKIDFVNYPFAWLQEAVVSDNLVLASDKDIAAMKIAAITGRGSKKDFIDLYFLLKNYTLSEMIEWYCSKFPDASEYLALKSLIYFDDADNQDAPEMLIPVSWDEIKNTIIGKHKEYLGL